MIHVFGLGIPVPLLISQAPCKITKVKGIDGNVVTTTHYGKLQTVYCDNQGKEVITMMIPKIFYHEGSPNAISLTKKLDANWDIVGNKSMGFWLHKDGVYLFFNIKKVSTPEGYILAGCFCRVAPSKMEAAATMIDKTEDKNITTAHKCLGHMNEAATRAAAAAIGYCIMRGTLSPCECCAIGKGRQANVPKESKGTPETLDES
jgi:hypothetical protein